MLNFAESSHPRLRATSVLERGELRSKEKRNNSIHFKGSEENIELILRTVISVNQLSINGAVPDLCKELSKGSRASGKPDAYEYLGKWKFPLNLQLLTLIPTQSRRETCCKNMSVNSNNYLMTRSYPNCALTLVWRLSKKDNSSLHLMKKKDQMKWIIYVESVHCLEMKKASRARGWIIGNTKIGPVLDVNWNFDRISVFETEQLHGFESWTESTNMSETISLKECWVWS